MNKFIVLVCLFLTACVSTEFSTIRGKGKEDVRRIKGDPATIIRENNYELWTYRQENCQKMVFFDEEGRAVDWYETGDCELPQ